MVKANPGKKLATLPFNQEVGMVLICHPIYIGSINRRTVVQVAQAKTPDPILKITKAKRTRAWLK
jgi:hypothetical protein